MKKYLKGPTDGAFLQELCGVCLERQVVGGVRLRVAAAGVVGEQKDLVHVIAQDRDNFQTAPFSVQILYLSWCAEAARAKLTNPFARKHGNRSLRQDKDSGSGHANLELLAHADSHVRFREEGYTCCICGVARVARRVWELSAGVGGPRTAASPQTLFGKRQLCKGVLACVEACGVICLEFFNHLLCGLILNELLQQCVWDPQPAIADGEW